MIKSKFDSALEIASESGQVSNISQADENKSSAGGVLNPIYILRDREGVELARIPMAEVMQRTGQNKESAATRKYATSEERIARAKAGLPCWEYLRIRFDYIGFGITEEISFVDIEGERLGQRELGCKTIYQFLNRLGGDGWEIVATSIESETSGKQITYHYYTFKRQVLVLDLPIPQV